MILAPSIRVTALLAFVAFLAIYAWKDWYKSLCGLILLMAVIEHEDMPRNVMGIQGLNPWNFLMLVIVFAWLAARRRERLKWDMPRHLNVLLLLYLGVILIGWLRAVFDRSHMGGYTTLGLVSEELINTLKWVIPGLLLFDGCRTRKRLVWGVTCILVMYLLLAVQVAKRLPPRCAIGGGEDVQRIRLKICQDIGYSSCDMSTVLAGASWAMLGILPMCRKRKHKAAVLAAFALTTYANALTGGRAGYVAWGVAGLVLCAVRWRKGLLLAPIAPLVLAVVFPAAAERMLTGFNEETITGETVVNTELVTSDRTVAWPYVVEEIGKSPVIGFGRLAMVRTGLRDRLAAIGQSFAHPHNMYLELLLDNGILGAIPVLAFFTIVFVWSARAFRDPRNPWAAAAGGAALSIATAYFVAGMGAQHFYPREMALGMWAAMMLLIRVQVERMRVRSAAVPAPATTGYSPRGRLVPTAAAVHR